MASKGITRLLNLFFPPRCPFCRTLLSSETELLCTRCQTSLPYTDPLHTVQTGSAFSQCVSPLFYVDQVRDSFHRFKFESCFSYAPCYGALMTDCVRRFLPPDAYDIITYVPLSKKRRKERGYDQAMLLANHISTSLSCPVTPLLEKQKERPPQSSLFEIHARIENAKGAYVASNPALTAGKRILLVDDIITTGATLSECARQLRAAGAADVLCVTLARGAPKK